MNQIKLLIACVMFFTGVAIGLSAPVGESESDPPHEIVRLTNELIEVLNSNRLWEAAPLLRPDVSKQRAMEIFQKKNPRWSESSEVSPAEVKNEIVSFRYLKPGVWTAKYRRFSNEPLSNAVWVKKGKLWYLIGYGWTDDLMQSMLRQYEADPANKTKPHGTKKLMNRDLTPSDPSNVNTWVLAKE